ncbi:MAG: hypothetical protein IKV45_04905 [Firmicutes bacterium]|nr:hypothetical protein [Bacillota bacterium]
MEKFLKLPGEAAFILASGYCTGVPVSAALIADLRQKEVLSQKEANRLLAYGSNVSPAFLLSAVSIAMLGSESTGPLLAAVHYGSNLLLMVVTCFYIKPKDRFISPPKGDDPLPPFSMDMLSEAIFQSLRTIFLIGGIILCFFILITAVNASDLIGRIAAICNLSDTGEMILDGLICGTLEITAGASCISAAPLSFSLRCSLLSAVLAFGGLSALMQIASVIRHTDLSLGFYLKYKIIQGVLAFAISLLFPVFPEEATAVISRGFAHTTPSALYMPQGIYLYLIMVALALILIIYRRLCGKRKR